MQVKIGTASETVDADVATMVSESINSRIEDLKALNHHIHSNPELCFKEFKAHDAIVAFLRKLNVVVTPHAYSIETSFEAEYGSGGRVVVFNAEYDALPEIGHACGHNLIAISSIAGFLAVVAVLQKTGAPGRVRLLGTPAEEGGGGKVLLIANGAYKSVDACLMAHPSPLHVNYGKEFNGDVYRPHVACENLQVSFEGKTAHAAFAPWQGVNALDAVVLGYNAVSMLRQQMKPTNRVHGIISHGGLAANIIPNYGRVEYEVRAESVAETSELKKQVMNCFLGASTATSCKMEVSSGPTYADLVPNKTLSTLFKDEMARIGLPMMCDLDTKEYVGGATDQGNVSYIVPSIHPIYGIKADEGFFNHTVGFTAAAITEDAFLRTIQVARGMAMSAWKMLSDDRLAEIVQKEFAADHRNRSPELLDIISGTGREKNHIFCRCAY
ncbi:related to amidohydrolase AmhX [Phialocephala subalpina]|uniref:Peptidase M20 domain-containing protein 2 n=1 Tax=Phialocephala subalpina TaxID=576137 RepID=A0A1L7WTN0_9HELO|nr:related to amidohydrolase AmhX [Phialocephala subalpina]